MCDTCGCNITFANKHLVDGSHENADDDQQRNAVEGNAIEILQGLLSVNDSQANHNRQHFDSHKVLAINLMSSPGSGKTSLLEATIERLKDSFRIAVIEGDLETENDANRIRAKGVDAVQIATGSACHLDAHMLHSALHQINLSSLDILFIENVGNLVCPASFDLGHHRNVTLLSVTEGDDKPAKYPVMFKATDVMAITKSDLLPYLDDFNPADAGQALRQLANDAPVLCLSSKSGEGIDAWIRWLTDELKHYRLHLDKGETLLPNTQADGEKLHVDQHAN